MIKFKKLPENIEDKLPALLAGIEQIEEVAAFYLHGSYATGDIKPLSDIDFAVLFNPHLPLKQYSELEYTVRKVIEENLNSEDYDLINMNVYPDRFSHNVFRTGKLIYCGDPTVLVDFIEQNNKSYLDFEYYRKLYNGTFLSSLGV